MAYRNCDLILSVREAEKNHDKWLKTRDMGIGGSDAAVIMGLNPYKSPYQLWMEKTGQAAPPDLSGNRFVYWGTKNEPNVAEWFQEETGKKVRKLGTLQNRTYPFMLANVDRQICGENAGLEIKTADVRHYKEWKDDEIPDAYYCQCLHYMAVTGSDYWYIAVLIGGNDPMWKRIDRNEDDVQTLISNEREFWSLVQTHTAPPIEIDSSKACSESLFQRYPGESGTEIDLPDDASDLIEAVLSGKQEIKDLKSKIAGYENELKAMLGDNEMGFCGDYKVTWKPTSARESISLAKLKKADAGLYDELKNKGFITISQPDRRFGIK